MKICAMSFGPPIEWIIAFMIVITTLTIFFLLCAIKGFRNNMTWGLILKVSALVPISMGILILLYNPIYNFFAKPMTVKYYQLEGDYVINKDWFKGKNSDWQYDHYWVRIADDTLYLNIMNNGTQIEQYKRAIYYVSPFSYSRKHTFFEFYNHNYYNPRNLAFRNLEEKRHYKEKNMIDSIAAENFITATEGRARTARMDSIHQTGFHHMLMQNPLLHADPFSFNIVLRSKKYGNMFFIKGRWRNRRNDGR